MLSHPQSRLPRTMLMIATVSTSALPAQTPEVAARYLIQRDTVRYDVYHPFRMYWVRGADTVGRPMNETGVETHVWYGTGEHLVVRVATQSLNVSRLAKTNTYSIMPNGRVITIDGKPPAAGDRGDPLVSLPTQPLRVGLRWSDTTKTGAAKGVVGEEIDEAIRDWVVLRVFDTVGTHVAQLGARGTWHMRLSFWADSAAGRAAWLDVSGPMEELALFDVTHGRLIDRSRHLDLRGHGVPPSGTPDTVSAGLLAAGGLRESDTPRTRFLLQALPGTDTSVTIAAGGSPVLLHTVKRGTDAIISSMASNDGAVGVAHVYLDSAATREYHATWADVAQGLLVEHRITRSGERLIVRSGARDTALAVPNANWTIGDYGMFELLVPRLLSLPRDGSVRPFAVYRPYPGHWDTGTATVTVRGGLLVATLSFATAKRELLAFTPEGDLLYGENSGPTGSRRFANDSARQARLRAWFASLQSSPSRQPDLDRSGR